MRRKVLLWKTNLNLQVKCLPLFGSPCIELRSHFLYFCHSNLDKYGCSVFKESWRGAQLITCHLQILRLSLSYLLYWANSWHLKFLFLYFISPLNHLTWETRWNIGCVSSLQCIVLQPIIVLRIVISFNCIPDLHLIFSCCSSSPILQQGSLNFHFIKSKNRVSLRRTFSGKPLYLLWYILSKLFRLLMSSIFWTPWVLL